MLARNLKVPLSAVNAKAKNRLQELRAALPVLARHPQYVPSPPIVLEAAGDEQEIRQAVHILDGRLADRLIGLRREFHHRPFRPATYRAGEMQVGGRRGAA